MSFRRAAAWLTLILPTSALWAWIAFNLPGGFVSQLERWQALIAGFLAIGGALIGGSFILRQIRSADSHVADQLGRRNDADRAMLPLALSELSRYSRSCAAVLVTLIRDAPITDATLARQVALIPSVPADAVRIIRDFIESTADPSLRARFSFLLNKLQVQSARLLGLQDEGRHSILSLKDYLLDAAEIYGICSSLFDFARREMETVPARISAEDMDSALNLVGARGDTFDDVRATARRRAASEEEND